MMAWGPIGHMTVAAVAYEKLTLAVKARVAVLLKLNPDYASWDKQVRPGATPEEHDRDIFIMAAVWADDIKGESQYSDDGTAGGNVPGGPNSALNVGYSDLLRHKYWHFVDMPFTQDGTALADVPTPNAQTQIDAFRAVIRSDAADELKSYDLVWLEHLIGDVHQPLHATARFTAKDLQGDAGGNNVHLQGDADTNLHAYWDDLPGVDCQYCNKKTNCVFRAVVLGGSLKPAALKAAANTTTADWIQESFGQAKAVAYQAPIGPGDGPFTIVPVSEYDVRAEKLARLKVALAGARLAKVLNDELK
jgi:hypothetical protein